MINEDAPTVWEVGTWVGTLPRDRQTAAVMRAWRWACRAIRRGGEDWSDLASALAAVLDFEEALAAQGEARLWASPACARPVQSGLFESGAGGPTPSVPGRGHP